MADLAEYVVVINGIDHTMKLDEAEAKRLDARPVGKSDGKGVRPANKAVTPRGKKDGGATTGSRDK